MPRTSVWSVLVVAKSPKTSLRSAFGSISDQKRAVRRGDGGRSGKTRFWGVLYTVATKNHKNVQNGQVFAFRSKKARKKRFSARFVPTVYILAKARFGRFAKRGCKKARNCVNCVQNGRFRGFLPFLTWPLVGKKCVFRTFVPTVYIFGDVLPRKVHKEWPFSQKGHFCALFVLKRLRKCTQSTQKYEKHTFCPQAAMSKMAKTP